MKEFFLFEKEIHKINNVEKILKNKGIFFNKSFGLKKLKISSKKMIYLSFKLSKSNRCILKCNEKENMIEYIFIGPHGEYDKFIKILKKR